MNHRDNYTHEKKAGKRRRNYLGLFITVFVLTIVLVLAVVFGVSALIKHIGQDQGYIETEETEDNTLPADSEEPSKDASGTTAAPAPETDAATETAADMITVKVTEEDAVRGNLILVNSTHEYGFADVSDLSTIYERKSYDYKVASSEIKLRVECIDKLNEMMSDFRDAKGLNDINVTVGYRDYETQMSIYSSYVDRYGISAAEGNVAKGGYSDHNTGLGFDLSVYTSDGVTQTLDYMTAYSWITDNCYKYGFVRRFDSAKSDITGVLGDEWHFRYVGEAHAYYMFKYSLCLEEYIEELKKYPADGEHLVFSDDGGSKWEIFYVALPNSGEASFELPEDAVYTLSGDNDGGVIVTVDITGKI